MGLSDFLTKHGDSKNTTLTAPQRLYYINAVNSFPLEEFKKLVPLNVAANKPVYDNIMIHQVLNISELSKTVAKIIETTDQRIKTGEGQIQHDNTKTDSSKVLIVISGIDIMFQNSNMSDTSQTHNLLNSTLLQLRLRANSRHKSFKTVILSRDQARTGSSLGPSQKRTKHDGNSVYQYISKYYADYAL